MKMLNAMDMACCCQGFFSLGLLFKGAFDLEKFGLKYIRVILLTSTFWHLVQPWQEKVSWLQSRNGAKTNHEPGNGLSYQFLKAVQMAFKIRIFTYLPLRLNFANRIKQKFAWVGVKTIWQQHSLNLCLLDLALILKLLCINERNTLVERGENLQGPCGLY